MSSKAVVLEDCNASMNLFKAKFWASSLVNFCYLVYFQIQEGKHHIYGMSDTIFQQIGRVVRAYISPGTDPNRFIVHMETKKKTSSATICIICKSRAELLGEDVLPEILDKYLWHAKCFSLAHIVIDCMHFSRNTRL
jgi:hypothetical protein